MTDIYTKNTGTYKRNAEISKKIKEGRTYEEIAKEYNMSVSTVYYIVSKYKMFRIYCDEMEDLIRKNEVSRETKIYELSKLLGFDNGTVNALIMKNIRSIDELLALTEEDIYKIKRIGKVKRNRIIKCINEYKEKVSQQVTKVEADNNVKEITKSVAVAHTAMKKQISKSVLGIKANRDYIYKLFKLVDDRQINLVFLQKEIYKEIDRMEGINKELLQTLSDLHYARKMPWTGEEVEYKIDLELKLQEVLGAYGIEWELIFLPLEESRGF